MLGCSSAELRDYVRCWNSHCDEGQQHNGNRFQPAEPLDYRADRDHQVHGTPQFSGSAVTGSVTVRASTGESCSAAPTVGACTITFQTGGPRTLTATYSGDGNVNGSASAAATQTVSSISLSTSSLLFGNQVVGTRSATQQVTIANVGSTTLTFTGFSWSPNFSDRNNCGGSLAPGRSCRITSSSRQRRRAS